MRTRLKLRIGRKRRYELYSVIEEKREFKRIFRLHIAPSLHTPTRGPTSCGLCGGLSGVNTRLSIF